MAQGMPYKELSRLLFSEFAPRGILGTGPMRSIVRGERRPALCRGKVVVLYSECRSLDICRRMLPFRNLPFCN